MDDSVRSTLEIMRENDISQMPVMNNDNIVGSISESLVLSFLLENPEENVSSNVESIMGDAFPIISEDLPCKQLARYIDNKSSAVIAKDKAGSLHILTQYDIIQAV